MIKTDWSNFGFDKSDYTVKTSASVNVDKQVSIMGGKPLEKGESFNVDALETHASSQYAPLFNISSKTAMNAKTLKEAGATALTPSAEKITNKCGNIIKNVARGINALYKELSDLMKDKSLSPDEITKKKEIIEAKIQATIKEAQTKMSVLLKLSDALIEFMPLVEQMKKAHMPASKLTEFVDKMINGIDVSNSSFNGAESAKDVQKISQKNMKNILGENSDKMLKETEKDTEKNVKELEAKLKDEKTPEGEKEKIKIQLEFFKIQKNLVKNLGETIKDSLKD